MKPISRDDVVARASFEARREVLQLPSGRNGKLDAKAAKRALSGELRDVFLEKVAAGAAPSAEELLGAYEARLASSLAAITGEGRSARFVSAAEAKNLSGALADAYAVLKKNREARDLAARAVDDPFPKGVVDRKLVFDTFLVAQGAKVSSAVFDGLKVEARLDALAESVAKKGALEANGIRALPIEAKQYSIHAGPAKLQVFGEAPILALTDGRSIVTFGRKKDLMYGEELILTRFDAKGGEPLGATVFQTGKGGMSALFGRLPASEKKAFRGLSDSGPKFTATDRAGLELVTRAVGALAGASTRAVKTATEALDGLGALETKTLGELAVKDGWVSKYRDLAERVKKGELSLGDADTFVRVAKSFVRYDGDEKKHVLVADRGPLLIVDNHFGGLGHAVALDALAKGELEVHVFHERTPLGRLHVLADGRTLETPGPNPMYRVANDLDEYLPAMLES